MMGYCRCSTRPQNGYLWDHVRELALCKFCKGVVLGVEPKSPCQCGCRRKVLAEEQTKGSICGQKLNKT